MTGPRLVPGGDPWLFANCLSRVGASMVYILTGVFASVVAGVLAERLGRTPVIFAMASLSMLCSFASGWLIGGPMGPVLATSSSRAPVSSATFFEANGIR